MFQGGKGEKGGRAPKDFSMSLVGKNSITWPPSYTGPWKAKFLIFVLFGQQGQAREKGVENGAQES